MKNQLRCLTLVMLLFAVTNVFSQCPIPGYTYGGTYNGHFYYLSQGDHTWFSANAEAVFLGGYLATIADPGENAFVAGVALGASDSPDEYDPGAWIGLNDIAAVNAWEWSNGEPVTYFSWAGGEPNGGTGENLVEINRFGFGLWNDLPDWVNYIESVVEFGDADCDGVGDGCDETFDDADCDGTGNGCDEIFNDIDCDGIGDGCDDETFNDEDCDGVADLCDDDFDDSDCDGVGDGCDNCDGGDDNGPCDAAVFPGIDNIPERWVCHDNGRKVFVCHEGNTICIDGNAVQAHLDHGDFLGPCTGCVEPRSSSSDRADFIVSPNPGYGDLTITLQNHSGTVNIYDQRGQLVQRVEGGEYQSLNIHLSDAGMYFVQLTTGKETITKKVMVVR